MAKSLDKVLQPDGTYKWELVEPDLSERMGNGVKAPAACPAPIPAVSDFESKRPNSREFFRPPDDQGNTVFPFFSEVFPFF